MCVVYIVKSKSVFLVWQPLYALFRKGLMRHSNHCKLIVALFCCIVAKEIRKAFVYTLQGKLTQLVYLILFVIRSVKIDPNHTGTEIHFIGEH